MADQDIAEGVGALSVQETVRGGNTVPMVPFVRIVSHFDRTHVQTLTEAERAERQAAKKAAKAAAKAEKEAQKAARVRCAVHACCHVAGI